MILRQRRREFKTGSGYSAGCESIVSMKIGIAQINTTIGDFEGNKRKILDKMAWAEGVGADILLFPEMAVTGYPPSDLLEKSYFILNNLETVEDVAKATRDTAVVIGYVSINEQTTGKGLFNSAALCHRGKIRFVQHKALLPTYGVFDEGRYFEPGRTHRCFEFKGKKLGITICEDVWSTVDFGGRRLYGRDPVEVLVKSGAEIILNISCSPYALGKSALRETLLAQVARAHNVPIFYANLVGGNDELIFDGRSLVVDGNGALVHEGASFEEDAFIIDTSNMPKPVKRREHSDAEEIYKALVLGVRDYVRKCNFSKVVVGLSGGIDSAVTTVIAVDAIGPEKVFCVNMPSKFSSRKGIEDAKVLAERLNVSFQTIEISDIYEEFKKTLKPIFKGMPEDVTEENIQARIRGNILMAFSNKYRALVLSTGNKSEMAVGYCTLYGDMVGGLAVIADVPKTIVYEIADYINRTKEIIPRSIIERAPSAELKPGQKDEDDLPPYHILDPILKAYVEEHQSPQAMIDMGFDRKIVDNVVSRVDRNEYKRRQAPPVLHVTSKAFGVGRVYPIAWKY